MNERYYYLKGISDRVISIIYEIFELDEVADQIGYQSAQVRRKELLQQLENVKKEMGQLQPFIKELEEVGLSYRMISLIGRKLTSDIKKWDKKQLENIEKEMGQLQPFTKDLAEATGQSPLPKGRGLR